MDREKLLIVEDDSGLRRQLRWCFDAYEVIEAEDRRSAMDQLRRHEPRVVLQDLGLAPDPHGVEEGMAALCEILALAPYTKVIVVTGHGQHEHAVAAVAMGALDYYEKPFDTTTLKMSVERAYRVAALEEEARQHQERRQPISGVIAASEEMKGVCRMVEKVAATDATVLLLGESGTGKELVARSLHEMSKRTGTCIAINCAAIPETLLESELFGYEKGAFTGAVRTTPGKIEGAHHGTLFLDEIGDMPLALQSKLLRFLQERKFERVGGREEIAVDVGVVAATNRDLSVLRKEGLFREDLFYRLSEVTIQIPPLRERGGDALVLARAFLDENRRLYKRNIRGYTLDAQAVIEAYSWPGNVRELQNRVRSAVIMAESRHISAWDLGLGDHAAEGPDDLNLRQVRNRAERKALQRALAIAAGNISRSSALLGITRPTFYDLLKKHRLHD